MKQKLIAGIDEVGRGPWAGPVVAAAVVMPAGRKISGLKDSKQISPALRRKIATRIKKRALGIGIGWASNNQLDKLGLTKATAKAMQQAMNGLPKIYQERIIDGTYNFLEKRYPQAYVQVRADQVVPSVMAASIIAKVARDEYMGRLAQIYAGYGFESHVGYGTALHRQRLAELGPSPIHRMSFKPLWGFANVHANR